MSAPERIYRLRDSSVLVSADPCWPRNDSFHTVQLVANFFLRLFVDKPTVQQDRSEERINFPCFLICFSRIIVEQSSISFQIVRKAINSGLLVIKNNFGELTNRSTMSFWCERTIGFGFDDDSLVLGPDVAETINNVNFSIAKLQLLS